MQRGAVVTCALPKRAGSLGCRAYSIVVMNPPQHLSPHPTPPPSLDLEPQQHDGGNEHGWAGDQLGGERVEECHQLVHVRAHVVHDAPRLSLLLGARAAGEEAGEKGEGR